MILTGAWLYLRRVRRLAERSEAAKVLDGIPDEASATAEGTASWGSWKYPQLLVLALSIGLAALFCIDVTRSPESIEVYSGELRTLAPAARRSGAGRSRPRRWCLLRGSAVLGARPNYRRLQVSVAASPEPQTANMFGTGAGSQRAAPPALPAQGRGTQILLRAELWNGTSVTKEIPAAPLLEGVAR